MLFTVGSDRPLWQNCDVAADSMIEFTWCSCIFKGPDNQICAVISQLLTKQLSNS